MHNLLPVRGAKVRDAGCSGRSTRVEALDQLGDSEGLPGQHNWPMWATHASPCSSPSSADVWGVHARPDGAPGQRRIHAAREIAETIEKPPPSLASYLGTRGYYGDLRHNVRRSTSSTSAPTTGNPANLNPLPPPQESSRRWLRARGRPGQGRRRGAEPPTTGATTAGPPSCSTTPCSAPRTLGGQGTARPHLRPDGLLGRGPRPGKSNT